MLLAVEETSPLSGNSAMFGTQPRNRTHQKTRRFSGFPFTSQRPYGGVHKKLGSPRSPIARATTLPTRYLFGCATFTQGSLLPCHTTAKQPALINGHQHADHGTCHMVCIGASIIYAQHCTLTLNFVPCHAFMVGINKPDMMKI